MPLKAESVEHAVVANKALRSFMEFITNLVKIGSFSTISDITGFDLLS